MKKFASTGDGALLLDEELAAAMAQTETRPDLTRSHVVPLVADRERARAGAWYEMVPRSQGKVPGKHGTFDDCIARVPEIAALGFDVLYLTPIHPIGHTNRKGKNNTLHAGTRRSRQLLRHRQRARRPRRGATRSSARSPISAGWCEACAQAQDGDRARLRGAVRARSSLAEAASGMVPHPAGRLDQVRREPAEEIRGHRQPGLQLRRAHRAVGGAARRVPVLGRARRARSSASTIRTPSRCRSGNG